MFTKRLQKLLDYYSLSASGLASKIGVQRSSISHVISGRNKPSLDFVMKILNNFNEVSIEWLIDGNGAFPKSLREETIEHVKIKDQSPPTPNEKIQIEHKAPEIIPELISKKNETKEIEKIILLYKDGSFESFNK